MRRTQLLLTVCALVAGLTPAQALPPAVGGAVASPNVEFVANVPDVPAIGGRIFDDLLYVTTGQGVRIYDLKVASGIPVPIGALELPHFENEDVDTNGEILLVAADHFLGFPRMLYVVDVRNPRVPVVAGVLSLPRGSGHTATCVRDCTYAWISGGPNMVVVDLTRPEAPTVAATFETIDDSHDVNVDDAGIAWVSGWQGVTAYSTANPVSPGDPLVHVATRRDENGPELNNNFVIHNSLRPNAAAATAATLADDDIDPGEVLLVTEEDWEATSNDFCANGGQFQTAWLRTVDGQYVVERLDGFEVNVPIPSDDSKPAGLVFCSAHWFDYGDGIVAISWYEQGVRFLDVSNPRDIQQVGYFMPAVTESFHTLLHGDRVYSIDAARGIDVLAFTRSAKEQVAPRLNAPVAGRTRPHPKWGYACRILAA